MESGSVETQETTGNMAFSVVSEDKIDAIREYPQGDSNPLPKQRKGKPAKAVASTHAKHLAHPLACKPQNLAQPGPADALDLTAAAAALAELPDAEQRAALDALAVALQALPLGARARLAGRLLEGGKL